MKVESCLWQSFGIGCFMSLFFTLNVFAGLTQSEVAELERLQVLVENNAQISEEQIQRWEKLLIKDPEILKKQRQKAIDSWKDSVKSKGGEIDEQSIDQQSEDQWVDFLEKKDKKLMDFNEKNVVILLRKIRNICSAMIGEKKEYPSDLNTILINSSKIIEPAFFKGVKKIYSIRYEKTYDSYRVLAIPRNQGITGTKAFLLYDNVIFFTLDGKTPTPTSNRLL